jgi:hypothetical protein
MRKATPMAAARAGRDRESREAEEVTTTPAATPPIKEAVRQME